MSNIYIINNTSGEALFAIQPKATNGPGAAGHNTDLTLYGYGAPNWGERFNENFYRLLENFACAEKEPGDTGYDALNPSPKGEGDVGITEKYGVNKPVLGQTWFNTTQDKLFVCTQVDPTVVWTPIASDDTSTAYVSKTGDTMSGFLTLHSSPVENMHAATKQYVDTGVASMAALFVRKSGDTMNTGQTLVLGRDPVGNMDAVTKQYVDAVAGTPGPINDPVKIGTVVPFAGTTTPENWLPCYGQAVSRTTYNLLFGVIGTTYGAGDGTTTFNLPDFRGRMPVGPDNYGGTAANVITNAQGDVLGGKYGAEFHTLTLNEIPSHTHTGSVNSAGSHTHQGYFPFQGGTQVSSGSGWGNSFLNTAAAGDHTHTVTINSVGTDAAHNNVQPSLTMYYIIKAKPEQTTIGGVSGDYVARGGDSMYGSLTMTGATDITLARAPTLPMHAVTKQYVDTVAGGGGGPAFGTVAVAGQGSVVADMVQDTLTLVAGAGITLTTNATSDAITISSTGGTLEPSWTYRTTITAETSLTNTTTYTNCGSTTFTVPGTLARNCIVVAHMPVEIIGYPYQIFVRMLLDGNVVDHNSFNINPSAATAREGHNLTFSYAGNLTPGSHTISFQGKLTSGQALSSGFSVYVNHGHVSTGATDPDTYTRVDVFVEGLGAGGTFTGGGGTTVVDVSAVGTVVPFAGATAPTDWLLCHGQAVSRATYSELFAVINTMYGAGDGSSTFNLPDLRGRLALGKDNMGGTSANVITDPLADTLGSKFGTESHTLTSSEMPSHTHTGSSTAAGGHTHTGSSTAAGGHTHTGSSTAAGDHTHTGSAAWAGDHAHQIENRYGVVNDQLWPPDNAVSAGDNEATYTRLSWTSTTGAHSHTLSLSTTGSHSHTMSLNAVSDHSHTMSLNAVSDHSHTMSLNSTGGGNAHNNVQPSTVLNYIIKAKSATTGTGTTTVSGSADENYIINGNFDLWERMLAYSASAGALVAPPTSFTINGPSQKKYTADRWFIASLTTGTYSSTVTRIAAAPGEVKGYKQYDLQWAISSATNRLYLAQRIEHVSSLSDGEITVSFVAKQTAGAATPLNVRLVQYFGTSGSPSVTVTSSPVTISATMQLHTVTLSLPSISGKTIGAGNFLEVAFETPETVSGVTYVFSRVQVEEGAAATKYKYRSVGTELDLCTRYFQHGYFGESKNVIPYIAGINALTNETWVPFPTRMRAVPVFSHAFAWGGQQGVYPENGGNIGYGTTTDGPFAVSVQPVGVQIQFAGFTAFPTSGGDASLAGWWQADAEL